MVNYDDHEANITSAISITEFRRYMAHYIATVRYGDDYVCIKRKNSEPVYLVSRADMELIWEKSDELHAGPRDAKGHRTGMGFLHWMRRLWKAEQSGDPAEVRAVHESMEIVGFGKRPKAKSP